MTTTSTSHGAITPEAVAVLRARMHKVQPIKEPFLRHVNSDSIKHVARALGDINPLWTDPTHAGASRFGKLVAPPALLYGVGWGSWDMRHGDGLPGVHGLHANDHWTYYRPLLDGDEVHATKELVKLEERSGAYAGKSMLQVRELKFYNQRAEPVARCLMSVIRAERGAGKKTGKYASIAKARYTDEEIRAIDDAIRAEEIRGATPRYWEDVAIGDAIGPIVHGPLSIGDMVAWMMGLGEPHLRTGRYWVDYRDRTPGITVKDPDTNIPLGVDRVHWDAHMAAEIGMPAPYDMGAQRVGWASRLMTNWAGDDAWLADLSIKIRNMHFVGDTVWIKGAVSRKWIGKTSGVGYVECTIEGINQRGDSIMPGTAIVALPAGGKPLPPFPIDPEQDGTA